MNVTGIEARSFDGADKDTAALAQIHSAIPQALPPRCGRWTTDLEQLPDTCFRLVDDRWITIQIHLRFGPWQGKREDRDPKLSHVSIWAAVEGENEGRQRLVIDNDFVPTARSSLRILLKIWLMPHLSTSSFRIPAEFSSRWRSRRHRRQWQVST